MAVTMEGEPGGGGRVPIVGTRAAVLLPLLLSVILSVTAGVKTYRRWKQHIRWRPWLFASYAMWMITTTYLIGSSSAVFVQVG